MIQIDPSIQPNHLLAAIKSMWVLSAEKIHHIEKTWDSAQGSPVFTREGKYTARGWTEWTQGFQFGSALLQYDATGEREFLRIGKAKTWKYMAPHLTHVGVHDHGFNNVSTYGNLWRLAEEGDREISEGDKKYCELALQCSGAVQARRWTRIANGSGFIYSFNGPHSLFADTIRSLRALSLSHHLGHFLMDENDRRISLLERMLDHAATTARYSVYYGEGRDHYDVWGRVAHESIFNTNDGNYRCPGSQQGFSPFSTWTRGLAWIMCGFAEQLEFMAQLPPSAIDREAAEGTLLKAARASCDFYLAHTPTDGIPYWDTSAPLLFRLGDYLSHPADPFNHFEPVDSSAAAIAAQGLLRLGHYLQLTGKPEEGRRYWQGGLRVMQSLLDEPYLNTNPEHQGLLLHSVYHRPNGWDFVPPGKKIPQSESSMWGDYHLREAALYLQRIAEGKPYLTFFGPAQNKG